MKEKKQRQCLKILAYFVRFFWRWNGSTAKKQSLGKIVLRAGTARTPTLRIVFIGGQPRSGGGDFKDEPLKSQLSFLECRNRRRPNLATALYHVSNLYWAAERGKSKGAPYFILRGNCLMERGQFPRFVCHVRELVPAQETHKYLTI